MKLKHRIIAGILLFILGFTFCMLACIPSIFQAVLGLFGLFFTITGAISIFCAVDKFNDPWYDKYR